MAHYNSLSFFKKLLLGLAIASLILALTFFTSGGILAAFGVISFGAYLTLGGSTLFQCIAAGIGALSLTSLTSLVYRYLDKNSLSKQTQYQRRLNKSPSFYLIDKEKFHRENKPFARTDRSSIYRLLNSQKEEPYQSTKYVVKCSNYLDLKKEYHLAPPYYKNKLLLLSNGSTLTACDQTIDEDIYETKSGRLVSIYGGEPIMDYLSKNISNSYQGFLLSMQVILGCAEELRQWHNEGVYHRDIHRNQFIYNGQKVMLIDSGGSIKAKKFSFINSNKSYMNNDLNQFRQVITEIFDAVKKECPDYSQFLPKLFDGYDLKKIIKILKENISSIENLSSHTLERTSINNPFR